MANNFWLNDAQWSATESHPPIMIVMSISLAISTIATYVCLLDRWPPARPARCT